MHLLDHSQELNRAANGKESIMAKDEAAGRGFGEENQGIQKELSRPVWYDTQRLYQGSTCDSTAPAPWKRRGFAGMPISGL